MTLALVAAFALSAPAGALELRGRLLADKEGADLEGYVVWLAEGDLLPKTTSEAVVREMRQVEKTFSPAYLALRAGDGVSFPNYDHVFHNVFSLDKGAKFDLGLFKRDKAFADDGKSPRTPEGPPVRTYGAPGKYHVFCNIHPDMIGRVHVFGHGYFSMTDRHGFFSIDVPEPGGYTLRIDGPRLSKALERKVEVPADGGEVNVPLKLKSRAPGVPHTRKDGSPYEAGGEYGGKP